MTTQKTLLIKAIEKLKWAVTTKKHIQILDKEAHTRNYALTEAISTIKEFLKGKDIVPEKYRDALQETVEWHQESRERAEKELNELKNNLKGREIVRRGDLLTENEIIIIKLAFAMLDNVPNANPKFIEQAKGIIPKLKSLSRKGGGE